MKITLSIKDIEKQINNLQSINKKLPLKVNWAIVKNLKTLKAEHSCAEELRIKILETYCMRDEKGNSIIENGNYRFENDAEARTAVKQIEELNMTTAEVDICTINIADIEKCNGSDYEALTTHDIEALEFMIQE